MKLLCQDARPFAIALLDEVGVVAAGDRRYLLGESVLQLGPGGLVARAYLLMMWWRLSLFLTTPKKYSIGLTGDRYAGAKM